VAYCPGYQDKPVDLGAQIVSGVRADQVDLNRVKRGRHTAKAGGRSVHDDGRLNADPGSGSWTISRRWA
jgi:hypothetical protein